MSLATVYFRPWCPRCDEKSPPGSRLCARCGLYLYPNPPRRPKGAA
jgi:predicted amidophosphoribosyltransferase